MREKNAKKIIMKYKGWKPLSTHLQQLLSTEANVFLCALADKENHMFDKGQMVKLDSGYWIVYTITNAENDTGLSYHRQRKAIDELTVNKLIISGIIGRGDDERRVFQINHSELETAIIQCIKWQKKPSIYEKYADELEIIKNVKSIQLEN
jgi:hypothetical protein